MSPNPFSGSDLADWEANYGRGGFVDLVAYDGVTDTKVPSAEIELGEWYHLHVVLDVDSKNHDIYLDGELVADDLTMRGGGPVDRSLNWFAFGWDRPTPLVGYVDNISIGTGMRRHWRRHQLLCPNHRRVWWA